MLEASGGKPLLGYVAIRSDGTVIVRSERSYRALLEGRGPTDWIGWPTDAIYDFDAFVEL